MRRTLFAVLFVFIAASLAFAAGEVKDAPDVTMEEKGSQPKIMLPEQRYDFGFAPEGFFLVHEYPIVNEGEGKLVIERVRTTCGCTSAPLKKKELEPGEETFVTVIFNSRRYTRRTSKGTIITSNDPQNRSVRMTFVANMDTSGFVFGVEPFGINIPAGEEPDDEFEFEITNESDDKYELEVIDWTSEVFEEPDLKDDEIKPGKTADLEVELLDDFDAAENYIKASVTLRATRQAKGEEAEHAFNFTIPVKGAGPK